MIEAQTEQQQIQYEVKYKQKTKKSRMKVTYNTQFDFVKKKLLKNLNLLTSNKFKISIFIQLELGREKMPYRTILLNTRDLINIAKRQRKFQRPIYFNIQSEQNLQEKKRRQVKVKVEFDSEGDVESIESEYQLVKPSNPHYKGKSIVDCVFCHRNSSEKQYIRLNGPFYGPFNKAFFHLLCAIWSPQIYLHSETNEFVNIKKEIKRCQNTVCGYCKEVGGGLGCKQASCKISVHFDCALKNDCQLNWQTYEMVCKACIQKRKSKLVQTKKQTDNKS